MPEYRVGNHQRQNVYRGDAYIGVMFSPEDAALVVAALNAYDPKLVFAYTEPSVEPWDSCTCPFLSGADPGCPVHQGRRPRGPKPPPLGEGCICDGSGRTCPRHGAVI